MLPGFFEIINRANIGHGEVYTTDDVAAGAVWVPPGVDDDGEQLAEALGQLMGPAMEKMYQIFQLLSEKHPRTAHYYLFFLGTTPNRQSQGIGTKLMKLVLDRCDREAIPAYLEASSEDNKRLYLRHGFDVTEEIRLPDGPPVWFWRDRLRTLADLLEDEDPS